MGTGEQHATVRPRPSEPERANGRRVAAATVVGTAIEWYDFYLYASMASLVFGRVFFDTSDPRSATLASLATFAVGFVARPFGGVIFGVLGDRLGRKYTLVATFLLMGVSTGVVGLLPSYGSAGLLGTVGLVVVRVFQGIGAGAEYAAAAITSYEHAGDGRRGSQAAWPALGMNIGLVLSALTIASLSGIGEDFLVGGGWRIPFLASFALVGFGIWVRSRVPETPEFVRLGHDRAAARRPSLRLLFRRDWRGLVTVVVVAIGYNAISYTLKTFSLAYVADYRGVGAGSSALALSVAGVVAIAAVPVVGRLCDRFSGGAVVAAGGVLAGVCAFPVLALLRDASQPALLAAMIAGTGIIVPMMLGAQGSFFAAQFPVETRSTGLGTGREIGTALSGGLAPLAALSLVAASPTHSTAGVGVLLAVAAVVVVVPAWLRRAGVPASAGAPEGAAPRQPAS